MGGVVCHHGLNHFQQVAYYERVATGYRVSRSCACESWTGSAYRTTPTPLEHTNGALGETQLAAIFERGEKSHRIRWEQLPEEQEDNGENMLMLVMPVMLNN